MILMTLDSLVSHTRSHALRRTLSKISTIGPTIAAQNSHRQRRRMLRGLGGEVAPAA